MIFCGSRRDIRGREWLRRSNCVITLRVSGHRSSATPCTTLELWSQAWPSNHSNSCQTMIHQNGIVIKLPTLVLTDKKESARKQVTLMAEVRIRWRKHEEGKTKIRNAHQQTDVVTKRARRERKAMPAVWQFQHLGRSKHYERGLQHPGAPSTNVQKVLLTHDKALGIQHGGQVRAFLAHIGALFKTR